MSDAATMPRMGKQKNNGGKGRGAGRSKDRHGPSGMLRFPLGLIYRLKRIAKKNNRPATWEARKVLMDLIRDEESRHEMEPITAEEVASLAEEPEKMTTEHAAAIVSSARRLDDE